MLMSRSQEDSAAKLSKSGGRAAPTGAHGTMPAAFWGHLEGNALLAAGEQPAGQLWLAMTSRSRV